MFEMIRQYKAYLESDCRFAPETVVDLMGQLPAIIDKLAVDDPRQIKANTVAREWRNSRWEQTEDGIRLAEGRNQVYLQALKEFLQYLEDRNMVAEKGIAGIINLPGQVSLNTRGLREAETEQLLSFLRFHLNNENQRRDTALIYLLMYSGCHLDNLLNLRVGNDGNLDFSRGIQCGDFEQDGDQVWVKIRGLGRAGQRVLIHPEALAFLRFYLENRSLKSALLFPVKNRKGIASPMSSATAKRAIERLVVKAGIRIKLERILETVRHTAASLGVMVSEEPRLIVSGSDARFPAETFGGTLANSGLHNGNPSLGGFQAA